MISTLTRLTLETFPPDGTVTGVWSHTLAAIFTLLQTDGYSENRERRINNTSAAWQMAQNLPHGVSDWAAVVSCAKDFVTQNDAKLKTS